jgi:Polyketide cyclase / dehydrase and lipid transport
MPEPVSRHDAPRTVVAINGNHKRPFHQESRRDVATTMEALFSYLDDHNRLSGHMSKSSWMMAGSHMDIAVDAAKGQAVGSHIRLKGRVLGILLDVEEVVTEHNPPLRKVWETIGCPTLLVIDHYRMGFDVTPQGASSRLRVFIDYALPTTPLANLAGRALGGVYARGCTQSMAKDAVGFFAHAALQNPAKGAAS